MQMLPQQIANPIMTGFSDDDASMGAMIDETVTAATVADPWAALSMAVNKNAVTNKGIFQEDKSFTI